jgi:hypothetical protein
MTSYGGKITIVLKMLTSLPPLYGGCYTTYNCCKELVDIVSLDRMVVLMNMQTLAALATYDAWDWARNSFKMYFSRRVNLIFSGLFLKCCSIMDSLFLTKLAIRYNNCKSYRLTRCTQCVPILRFLILFNI